MVAIAAVAGLALALSTTYFVVSANDDDEERAAPERRELTYPNLGSHLDAVVDSYEDGRQSESDAAEEGTLHQDNSIAVTVYLTANVAAVKDFLDDNGATVRNVGEDYIEAYVPVSLLGRVSEQDGVVRVREIIPPVPDFGSVTSQGVAEHLATAWHGSDYRGAGVKVGIIDSGFQGWQSLQGSGELPSSIGGVRCYTDDAGNFSTALSACDNPNEDDDNHGTAVGEAVIDIAPEATLYIAIPETPGDLQKIVQWMAGQGVQVINMSLTWGIWGPGNGTSHWSNSPYEAIDDAVKRGIVWVNSGGNRGGGEMWYGAFSDANGDGFHEWEGSDDAQTVDLEAGQEISVSVHWQDQWRGATRDLNLLIYDHYDVSTPLPADGGDDPQAGGSGDIPYERMTFTAPVDGRYDLVIYRRSGTAPGWLRIWIRRGPNLEFHTAHHTTLTPADSSNSGMLAVGATHYWETDHTIAPYSSQGPTLDGRIKPDITGVACGSSATYPLRSRYGGQCGFSGTSQASPHVAGLAALVKQAYPGYGPVQLAAFLKNHAAERGAAGPDNTWGHGFAQLPPAPSSPVPPCPNNSFPCNLTATPGDGQVSLAWTNDPTHGQNQVYIKNLSTDERSDETVGTVSEHTVIGLTNGEEYEFWVRSRPDDDSRWGDWTQPAVKATPTAGGAGPTPTATPGPGTPTATPGPGAPTPTPAATPDPSEQCDGDEYPCNVAATAGDGQVTLSWTANSSHQSHQIFARNTVTKDHFHVNLGAVSEHTVTGLTNGDLYHFWVRSRTDDDSRWLSAWAGPVEATPTAGSGGPTPTPTTAPTPTATPGPGTPTPTPGPGTPSPTPTATPDPSEQCEDDKYPCNLAATAGDGQVTLSWTANSSHQSQQIFVRNTVTRDYFHVNLGAVSEHTVTGLTNGDLYHFWVRSRTDDDSRWLSAWAGPVEATPTAGAAGPTPTATPGPGTPSPTPTATPDPSEQCEDDKYPCNLAATAGDGQVTLSWTANSSHQSQQIFVRNTVTRDYFHVNLGAVSEHTVTGLTNGDLYHFWVRSRTDDDSRWLSAWAGPVEATPREGTQ